MVVMQSAIYSLKQLFGYKDISFGYFPLSNYKDLNY